MIGLPSRTKVWLATNVLFDAIECTDALECLAGDRRRPNSVQIVQLSACMGHACSFANLTAHI